MRRNSGALCLLFLGFFGLHASVDAVQAKGSTCTLSKGEEYIGTPVDTFKDTPSEQDCCDLCASKACYYWTYLNSTQDCLFHTPDAPDHSRVNADAVSGFNGDSPPAPSPPDEVAVDVDTSTLVSSTNGRYVCWNLDASRNRQFFDRDLNPEGELGGRIARQTAALSANQRGGASIVRFGGSGNDYLTYEVNGTVCPPLAETKECMNMTWWKNTLLFTNASNAGMVFGVSMNTGVDSSLLKSPPVWDGSNARDLLQWTITQGLDHLLFGLELGNEQNHAYTGKEMASNLKTLHAITVELWPQEDSRPVLIGPDPHSMRQTGPEPATLDWIAEWLDETAKLDVPVYAANHHEYIEVDSTTFLSAARMDVTGDIAKAFNYTVATHSNNVQRWAGEIGPHNGGSPVCDHTSMRWANFGNSLWYADALASKAQYGYQAFCRQDLIGADYGMLDCSTGEPLPDFWTGVIYASTMGDGVLSANVTTDGSSAIRAYAHCSNPRTTTTDGVTVLLVNLAKKAVDVRLPKALTGSGDRTEYHLEGTDHASHLSKATGLLGTEITLNSVLLEVGDDGTVPDLEGKVIAAGDTVVQMMETSIAFVVFPDASAAVCAAVARK